MRRLLLCLLVLLAGCLQKPPGDNIPMDEVRKIHEALKKDERSSVKIVEAIYVRDSDFPQFICGVYETPRSRREGYVKMFMWSRGRLLPGTFHDNIYACRKQQEINAGREP